MNKNDANPEAEILKSIPQGSVESGLRGQYDLPIKKVFGEAWANVYGIKRAFIVGQLYVVCWLLMVLLIGMLILLVLGMIPIVGSIANIVMQVVIYAFTLTFSGYLNRIAIRHLQGEAVSEKGLLGYFKYVPKMFVNAIAFGVLNFVLIFVFVGGAILLWFIGAPHGMHLSGLLFMLGAVVCGLLCYILLSCVTTVFNCSLAIAIDRDIKPLKAAHIFFLVLLKKLPRLVGINILCGSILLLSMIPVGIPLIWTVPWVFSVNAVIIKRSIGLQRQVAGNESGLAP